MKIKIYTKEKVYNFKSTNDKDYEYALKHAHREDNPAYIEYYKNGNIKTQEWHLNGIQHRENGPAVISYYQNGDKKHESWYLNDQYYFKDSFKQIMLKKKLKLI